MAETTGSQSELVQRLERAVENSDRHGCGMIHVWPDTARQIVAELKSLPDLIAACKMALQCCGDPMDWNGETRAFLLAMQTAIAKATA